MTFRSGSHTAVIAAAVLLAAGLAGWYAAGSRSGAAPSQAATAAEPPRTPVAVRLAAIHPEPGAPVVVAVQIFNHIARQASATNAALDAAAVSEPRKRIDAINVDVDPAAWTSAVTFSSGPGTAAVAASHVRVVRRPEQVSHRLGAGDVLHLVFEVAPEGVATLGSTLMATARLGGWTVGSNAVPLAPPDDPILRVRQRGKAAYAIGDYATALAAGDVLVAADASNPWGHWYRGLALEAQGDRAGALEAYETAVARLPEVSRMPEPPVDLFRRIAALR